MSVYINTDDVKPPSSLRRGNQVGEAENEGEKEPPLVLYTSRRRSSTDAAQAAWALPLSSGCGWLLPLGNIRLAPADSLNSFFSFGSFTSSQQQRVDSISSRVPSTSDDGYFHFS
jgi:hypothetical protein